MIAFRGRAGPDLGEEDDIAASDLIEWNRAGSHDWGPTPA